MKIQNTNTNSFNFAGKTNEEKSISDITNFFKTKYSLIDIVQGLNKNKDLKSVSPSLYKMGENHSVIIGPTFYLADVIDNLKKVKSVRMSCAPEIVNATKSSSGHYSMFIVKHPKIQRDNPIYEENKNRVSSVNKAKFVQELIRFNRETQLYNPQILDNPNSILTTENDELFVLDWSSLEKFQSETQKNQWFNKLRTLLNLETI